MNERSQRTVSETARREEEVIAFWNDEAIFERTLEKDAPQGEFVFYDGPPFATGLPHMGHLLISSYKDAIGRYKTMRGYRVPRRWGWDCHGLPIENIVEKKLGLKNKKDIEALGVDRFNEEARKSVLTYVADWKHYIERLGRWVDFDNSYKTMDNSYIESVWWGLKKLYDEDRLYEGRKVLMYCPRCETPLSKAEIAMDNSYKDVTDDSVIVRFKIKKTNIKVEGDVYILAWTTTPWTLPANVALAVGERITYALVRRDGAQYILAKERLKELGENVTVVRDISGGELVGTAYEPLYTVPKVNAVGSAALHTVVSADFVTTEEGTGVVHIAPMYGEDDHELGVRVGLPIVPLLDATGTFNADAPSEVRGMYFKKGNKYVIEDLGVRELLVDIRPYLHSYPHCYRCGTPLIYNALTSWFVNIRSVRDDLLKANKTISWYPEHLKEGRFRHIIETAPDWTISRNRFWASPLPIWKHETTGAIHVFGSLRELRERTVRSGNRYLMVRHGQAESNVQGVVVSTAEDTHGITELGKEQARGTGETLKKEGVTKIIASPLLRTRETAEEIAKVLGIDKKDIIIDDRFREWNVGELDGKPVTELHTACATYEERFNTVCAPGAETLQDMKRRIGDALYDLEEQYKGETILIVGHEYTLWLAECVAQGADLATCISIRGEEEDYVRNGEVRTLDLVPIPHNAEYELDLHRPYIDMLPLVAEDGGRLVRIPEVVDCWMESGAMPFASEHYPHENTDVVKRRYPGDFIAEYIAQTRTWFYYMHVLGVLLFSAPSFKNCIATGTVLAADGTKMSKSKGNFTDPLESLDRYGADALRLYLMGSVVMTGEDLAFKDEEIREAHNRFINMFWNSYKFFELNKGDDVETRADFPQSTHVLDRWILARVSDVHAEVTDALDAYNTVKAVRVLRDLVSDLSTWYIRRSRDRFRSEDSIDRVAVRQTTQFVLIEIAKLMAPITPFIAENVYRGCGGEEASVHLAAWPEGIPGGDDPLVADMAEVRRVASIALEARQRAGIKVRQPLPKLILTNTSLKGKEALLEVLADEVNVKVVEFGSGHSGEVTLDTTLTPELVREGHVRELVRSIQDLRKRAGLAPEHKVRLTVDTDTEGKKPLEDARAELTRVAGVAEVTYTSLDKGDSVKIGDHTLTLTLDRI
jgi:isoleucyl-tRNA synthetase